jgi:sialidase-1
MVLHLRGRPRVELMSLVAVLLAWRSAASLVAIRIQPPGTPVFWQGAAGISCYRIPSVVQVPRTGALIALAEARHGNCNDQSAREIAARSSHDGGRSWTPIRFVAGDYANGDKWLGNPAIVVTASGRLLLAVSKHSPGCVGNWCAPSLPSLPSLTLRPEHILSPFLACMNVSQCRRKCGRLFG